VLALEFPPITHLTEWPDLAGDGMWAINKIVLLFMAAAVLVLALAQIGGRKQQLVPKGVQNFTEWTVDLVENEIGGQVIGHGARPYTPLLMTIFSFILALNLIGLIPFVQMPGNARIALPALMAILVWIVYHAVGFKHQGFFGYWKNVLFMPGVPVGMYVLLTPIELVTDLIVRPLSLSVRLFANLLAGHLILVTFALMTDSLVSAGGPGFIIAPLTFVLLALMTVFEFLVAYLQAYIFTILTAVYIGGAIHPEH
jgi:F-type H+-transporting ATPase subunit a